MGVNVGFQAPLCSFQTPWTSPSDCAANTSSCSFNGCHTAAGHGFLVIQRPRTPVLDNLRAEPPAGE